MTPDELLTTTRAVRRRLDFTRPVEREVIEACVRIAQQAPTPGNRENWHFVVVTDPAKRQALAEIYQRGWAVYTAMIDTGRAATAARDPVRESAAYLAERLADTPVLVIPCFVGRVEREPHAIQAAAWGGIAPAIWSFMLAARARGLGTVWTTLHLFDEEAAAAVLGIPHRRVTQAALIPVAYYTGARFRPAPRKPVEQIIHWNGW
ncbi:MAG: nitroreductase family protein [Dehalococcoidia bacterium]|nr:nitroreductase family protein [Dehalococcoidia bacterium]